MGHGNFKTPNLIMCLRLIQLDIFGKVLSLMILASFKIILFQIGFRTKVIAELILNIV